MSKQNEDAIKQLAGVVAQLANIIINHYPTEYAVVGGVCGAARTPKRLTPLYSADVPFRIGQPAVFWTHCWNRTDEPLHYVSKEHPELAQNFLEWGGQQCSVNELAKELATL